MERHATDSAGVIHESAAAPRARQAFAPPGKPGGPPQPTPAASPNRSDDGRARSARQAPAYRQLAPRRHRRTSPTARAGMSSRNEWSPPWRTERPLVVSGGERTIAFLRRPLGLAWPGGGDVFEPGALSGVQSAAAGDRG